MFFKNFSKHSTLTYPLAAATAATGDTLTSSAIDTLSPVGHADVMVGVKFGTITATGTGVVKLQHSSDDGSTDAYADVAGSGYTYTAATDSTKAVIIDVHRPLKRYIKVIVTRATANVVVENGFALLYHTETQPQQGTTVTSVKVLNSPASGTA